MDLPFGVLFGPAVDLGTRGFGIGHEIERRKWGVVVVGEGVLEGRLDGEALLHPESVGGVQFVASGVAGLGEVGEQGSKGGIVGGVVTDVEDGLNFFGCPAACSRKGHRENSGDVERGEDQVCVAPAKLFVGGDGEGVHGGHYTRIGGRQGGGEQDGKKESFHKDLPPYNVAIVAVLSGMAWFTGTDNIR